MKKINIADEFFSLSPKHRTKKNLNKLIIDHIAKPIEAVLDGKSELPDTTGLLNKMSVIYCIVDELTQGGEEK